MSRERPPHWIPSWWASAWPILCAPLACAPQVAAHDARDLVSVPCAAPPSVATAECGVVRVPENRETGLGRRIELHVLRIPSGNTDPAADLPPVFFLAGGPGASAIGLAPAATRLLTATRANRALVFVDVRGTGASAPLDCDMGSPSLLQTRFQEFLPLDLVRACRDRLERTADLTQYTSAIIADDLDDVRAAMGYERIVLFGGSGGTRQALVYARRYPTRVAAMVLDGVVPLSFRMPLPYAIDTQAALDSTFSACARDPQCGAAFPDLPGKLARALASLEVRAARVPVRSADGSDVDTISVSHGAFITHLRAMLYAAARARWIPLIVARAEQGDYEPFAALVLSAPPTPVALGHFLSMTCAEDVARIDQAVARSATAGSFLGDYRLVRQADACAAWRTARVPASHFREASLDVPALLLSGAVDPVTPPRWADTAMLYLPRGRHVILPHSAHGVWAVPCATQVVEQFLAVGSADSLDTRCTARVARAPFVTSMRAP